MTTREQGDAECEHGVLKRWTRCVHDTVSTGAPASEEFWWESSDAFDFKELGAEKKGSGLDGERWTDKWQETHYGRESFGGLRIEKSADKFGVDASGKEWHEKWMEKHFPDGRCERNADKWARLAPGTIAEDQHGDEWGEKWGEEWARTDAGDVSTGFVKWTDKWASRREREGGGPGRSWGDKWEDRFGCLAPEGLRAFREGESWSDGGGSERYSRTWCEEYCATGCNRFGQSTTGEYWDTMSVDAELVLGDEGLQQGGWNAALLLSRKLMSVAPRQ